MKTYRTKTDFWLMGVIVCGLALPTVLILLFALRVGGLALWMSFVICVLPLASAAWSYFSMKYKVTSTAIYISGGFFKRHVPLNEIKSVRNSRDPLASPAFSLDRLEIVYGANKRVLISPKDKNGFLRDIGWLNKIDA